MAIKTAADYLQQLQDLLPQGLVWTRMPLTVMTKLLQALADEFARIETRCAALIDELHPSTTLELLPDFERVFGLPDSCVTQAQSIDQRRAALRSKMTYSGGQSRAYFIGLAAELGYQGATIDEYPAAGLANQFEWRINLPGNTGGVNVMVCTGTCDDWLQDWSTFKNDALECRIKRFKPAHTNALFAYI